MHNIEAADLREVPRNRPILWALDACYMGNEPVTCSLNARHLVPKCPLDGLLQTA